MPHQPGQAFLSPMEVSVEAHPVLVAAVDRLLHQHTGPDGCHVLDLGGGTGGQAVRLAVAGHRVTVVDPSPDALAALGRRAREAGVSGRINGIQGDAEALADVVEPGSVDVLLCHEVLEQVDDPAQALRAAAEALRSGGGISVLVAQRCAAVLARAVTGRVREADAILTSDDGRAGPKDPLRRRFTWDQLRDLLVEAGFAADTLHRGAVGVFSDLVPVAALVDDPGALAVLDRLDVEACANPAFLDVAAGLHVVALRR